MRLYIIGLPGSGKTTLAKKLAAKQNLTHYELDQLFHQFENNKYTRLYFEDFGSTLIPTLTKDNQWVVEGVYPISEICLVADNVIYIQESTFICIYRQWRRYFTDPAQRDRTRFGVFTNIGLTLMIIGASLNIWGIKVYINKPRIKIFQFLNNIDHGKLKIFKDSSNFHF